MAKHDLTPGSARSPLTVGEVLRRSAGHLAAKGSDTPRLDAELLLGQALGLERIELYMHLDRPLDGRELEAARDLVARRARREPLQYVLGEWGFRRLTLAVDRRALIPRPETEVVVERALALLEGVDRPRVLDVGTGSGAIALALADEHPGASVTGIDLSPAALDLARDNAARTGIDVEFAQHDLREGLPDGPWELVVANPPYVEPSERDALPPEVREWEPEQALYGTGMHELVADAARTCLVAGGALVLEVGDGQAASVGELLGALGYTGVRVTDDLAGRARVVEGRR